MTSGLGTNYLNFKDSTNLINLTSTGGTLSITGTNTTGTVMSLGGTLNIASTKPLSLVSSGGISCLSVSVSGSSTISNPLFINSTFVQRSDTYSFGTGSVSYYLPFLGAIAANNYNSSSFTVTNAGAPYTSSSTYWTVNTPGIYYIWFNVSHQLGNVSTSDCDIVILNSGGTPIATYMSIAGLYAISAEATVYLVAGQRVRFRFYSPSVISNIVCKMNIQSINGINPTGFTTF